MKAPLLLHDLRASPLVYGREGEGVSRSFGGDALDRTGQKAGSWKRLAAIDETINSCKCAHSFPEILRIVR
jgi:hypothetical protein